jgi:spermidine/putrescine transport system substrate-binding protein
MTFHPKERGLSRRQVLTRAAGAAAGIGATGTLAACANTTTPVDASCGSGGTAASALAQKLVEVKPVGPGGLPLPRSDNSVTWKIAADNPAIPAGKKPEGGTLRVYNYADYIDPETVKKFQSEFHCSVSVATYNSADEAFAKLASGAVSFDVVIGLAGSHIVNLMAKQIIQPLNHEYLPNLAKNIWPELQSPFYDGGARYTVPYVVWSDGIGWRNDLVKEDIASLDAPWDIFWHSQAYRGKVGILDDYRDGIALGIQRDAQLKGQIADLNTEDPAIIAKAGEDLQELTSIANAKITITDYQTLPEGKTVLHHSWSGDLIGAAIYYLPKGTPPTVLSYWAPDRGGVVQNDFLFIPKGATKPALAHAFLNFFLDEKNAYSNFVNFTGYIPPQVAIDGDALVKQELIPKTLATAVVRRDQFASNQELLSLTVNGDKLWQTAWAKFKAG